MSHAVAFEALFRWVCDDSNSLDMVAARLHAVMERLDPTEDAEWANLSQDQKEFYRTCATEVIKEFLYIAESSSPTTT